MTKLEFEKYEPWPAGQLADYIFYFYTCEALEWPQDVLNHKRGFEREDYPPAWQAYADELYDAGFYSIGYRMTKAFPEEAKKKWKEYQEHALKVRAELKRKAAYHESTES